MTGERRACPPGLSMNPPSPQPSSIRWERVPEGRVREPLSTSRANRELSVTRSFLLRWTGPLTALLAVLLASGTHWVALQAVAFGSMIVRYAQDVPLSQAIADTFDGQHPCPLCHAVQEGRQQEQKQRPLLGLESRSELTVPPTPLHAVACPTLPFELPPLGLTAWNAVSYPPPKPPPRPA